MNNQDEQVAAAVEAERKRCVEIIELYQQEFAGSLLQSVWCRMRNHVASGDYFVEQPDKKPEK